MEMKKVYGQKKIRIHKIPYKQDSKDKNDIFGIVNKEAMCKASQKLTYNEFRIYMFMVMNEDGYEFKLSTKYIADKFKSDKRNIQRGINSLIEKGYLIHESENKYIFRENITNENEKNMEICENPPQDKDQVRKFDLINPLIDKYTLLLRIKYNNGNNKNHFLEDEIFDIRQRLIMQQTSESTLEAIEDHYRI